MFACLYRERDANPWYWTEVFAIRPNNLINQLLVKTLVENTSTHMRVSHVANTLVTQIAFLF